MESAVHIVGPIDTKYNNYFRDWLFGRTVLPNNNNNNHEFLIGYLNFVKNVNKIGISTILGELLIFGNFMIISTIQHFCVF